MHMHVSAELHVIPATMVFACIALCMRTRLLGFELWLVW